MDNEVTSLDDMDTEIIKREGWSLDRVFVGDLENTMTSYEEAIVHAETLLKNHKTALRSIITGSKVFLGSL